MYRPNNMSLSLSYSNYQFINCIFIQYFTEIKSLDLRFEDINEIENRCISNV